MNINCTYVNQATDKTKEVKNYLSLYNTNTINIIFKGPFPIKFNTYDTIDQVAIYDYLVKAPITKDINTEIEQIGKMFNEGDFKKKLLTNKVNIENIKTLIDIIFTNQPFYLSLSLAHYLYKSAIKTKNENEFKLTTFTIEKIIFKIPIYSYMYKIKTEIKKNNPFFGGANYSNHLEFYTKTDYIDFNKYQPNELFPLLNQIRNEVIYSDMSDESKRNIVDMNEYKLADDFKSIKKPKTKVQDNIIKIIGNKYQYFEMLPFIHLIYKNMADGIDNDLLLSEISKNLESYNTSKYINLILVNMQTYEISELKLFNNNTITQENLNNYIKTKDYNKLCKISNELYRDLSIQIHNKLFKNKKHKYNYLLIREQIFMTYNTIKELNTNNIYYNTLKELAQKITHPQLTNIAELDDNLQQQKSLYAKFEQIITITNLYNQLINIIKSHIDTSQIIEDHKIKINEIISDDDINEYQTLTESVELQISRTQDVILRLQTLKDTMNINNITSILYNNNSEIDNNAIDKITKVTIGFIITNKQEEYNEANDHIDSLSRFIKVNLPTKPPQPPVPTKPTGQTKPPKPTQPSNAPQPPTNPLQQPTDPSNHPKNPPQPTQPSNAPQPPKNPLQQPTDPSNSPKNPSQQPSNLQNNAPQPPTNPQKLAPTGIKPPQPSVQTNPLIPPVPTNPLIPTNPPEPAPTGPTNTPKPSTSTNTPKSNLIKKILWCFAIVAFLTLLSIAIYKYINNDDKSEEDYEYEPNFVTLTQNLNKPTKQTPYKIEQIEQKPKQIEQNSNKIKQIATTEVSSKSTIVENHNVYSNDQHITNNEEYIDNEEYTDNEEYDTDNEDQYNNEEYGTDNEDQYINDENQYNDKNDSADNKDQNNKDDSTDNADQYNDKYSSADEDNGDDF